MMDRRGSQFGDSGLFVKSVKVSPIDTVCAGELTGAWSDAMTLVYKTRGSVTRLTSRRLLE